MTEEAVGGFASKAGSAGLMDGFESSRFPEPTGGVAVFLIDPQIDFHEGGSLAVTGATADSQRIADFIESQKDSIERIVVTLDTHHKMHIHNGGFWKNSVGGNPAPFTTITKEEVKKGVWMPVQPEMNEWAIKYVESLEAGGRFQLLVWPDHCILGTRGHCVHPPLMEALGKWALYRGRSINWYFKGQNNRSEMYSALKAEVELEDDKTTSLDNDLIKTFTRHQKVVCCGEALSHCVNFSTRDLLSGWPKDRAADIVVLEDGASAVTGAEDSAATFLKDMRAAGVTVCKAASFKPPAKGNAPEPSPSKKGMRRSLSRLVTASESKAGSAGLMDGCPPKDIYEGGYALFIIDPQNDFHDGGSLAVPGAVEDSKRIADFIRENSSKIERIVVTLDTHHKMHIHHAAFWEDQSGNQPAPGTTITHADVKAGVWEARQPHSMEWALKYTERLEASGRFKCLIWPDHCLLGTEGHCVHPPLMSALNDWASRRGRSISWYFKGQNNNTEMYSALKAEVELDDDLTTSIDKDLIDTFTKHQKVICCGEALSHCVNFTVRDLLSGWPKDRVNDIVLLRDCASAVPGFEDDAQTFVKDMQEKGVTVSEAAIFGKMTILEEAKTAPETTFCDACSVQ